ncbi:MSMEG_0570 family nitrogen starvation response protein [Klenkia brasiliensis]|nr:MSMEG_0570 family nitrogen starvation response protein [Klenkia brasiliensis]
MPEVEFDVHWPDGRSEWVYSPSLVVEDVFAAGHPYPVAEFVELARSAMATASDRVQARWGFPCSRAAATLARIEHRAAGFADGEVTVVAFRRR